MNAGILELTVVLALAAVLGTLARILKQPVIVAYLITGGVIGYFGFFDLLSQSTFGVFADLGITFLLFLVGLEINYSSLRLVGRTSVVVGLSQIIFTFAIGFLIATAFSFDTITSAYIAIALTFSSTIIIVKLLSEKRDLNSLYGKISIGFMLVQDFVAILLIVVLSGVDNGGGINLVSVLATILKGVGVFAIMLWLGRKA